MNRIRRYFVEQDPSIAKFLLFPYHDEPTNYLSGKTSAGVRRTAQTVQSFIMGLAFVIAVHIASDNILASIVAGLAAFGINVYLLERNAKRRLSRELTKALSDIRFPKTEDHSQDMSV
jgi:Flp pilus assembly protein TadB